jgi:hypothetical protein
MNSRQRQRWSLMTVLYSVVRTSCYALAWLTVLLTPKCSRYAMLECLILCMSRGQKLVVLIAYLWWIVSNFCVCIIYTLCSILLTGFAQLIITQGSRWRMQWVSRNHLPPIQLIHISRGEWNSDHWPWFNIMTAQVWVECLILVRGDHWLSVSGNILSYAKNWTNVVITAMLGGELQNLSDIDSTERCCKLSWLLGYMLCIKDPEPCLSSLLSFFWLSTSPVWYSR